MKPRIFIGSSSEKLQLAYDVQESLGNSVHGTVWKLGVFEVGQFSIESLFEALEKHDFAVFVFAPDDVTRMRGAVENTVRDNVIFELGLFMGRLGRQNTFMLTPASSKLHLPSDLVGITTAPYEADREDGNFVAAIGVACNQIRRAIMKVWRGNRLDYFAREFVTPSELGELWHFCNARVPESLAPIENWEERMRSNREIYYWVTRHSIDPGSESATNIGSFAILPLTADAVSKIDVGAIKGIDLVAAHVSASLSDAAGAYISWVIAGEPSDAAGTRNPQRNAVEKAATFSALKVRLEQLVDMGINAFYTRPFTDDGLRMCVKWKFVSLSGGAPRKGETCKRFYR